MSVSEQITILAHVFAGRIAWVIAEGERSLGHGACQTFAELRQQQIVAGIATVAIHCTLPDYPLGVQLARYPGEWRRVTPEESARLQNFFVQIAQQKPDEPVRPTPALA